MTKPADTVDTASAQPLPTGCSEVMATKTMIVVGSVDLIQPADKKCQETDCWWEIAGSHGPGAQDGWVVFASPRPGLKPQTAACVTAQFPLERDSNPFLSDGAAAAHYPRLVRYRSADQNAPWGVYEASDTESVCGAAKLMTKSQEVLDDREWSSVPEPGAAQNTPAQISPPDAMSETVSSSLAAWARAEESNDPEEEAQAYAGQIDRYFLSRNVTRQFVRDYMTAWFQQHPQRVVTFVPKDVQLEDAGTGTVKVRLIKDVVTRDDQGTSERFTRSLLLLRKEDGVWKIFSEQDFKHLAP